MTNVIGQGSVTDSALTQRSFTRADYVVLPRLVSGPALVFLYDYLVKRAHYGNLRRDDPTCSDTPVCSEDPIIESLLEELLPWIEQKSERPLFPTYTYYRVYKRGDFLVKHRDRAACEVSLTLSAGYQAPQPWPIWLRHGNQDQAIRLEPGDALLYKGCDITHWREPFDGDHAAQVFLHYVDQQGPHREWRFDKRGGLATTPISARLLERFRPYLGWPGCQITPRTGESRAEWHSALLSPVRGVIE